MKKLFKKLIPITLLVFIILPTTVLAFTEVAVNPLTNVKGAAPDALTDKGNLNVFLGTLVEGLLGLVGVLFVILIIYAGVQWMTAGGDATKVQKAKSIIIRAILGLIIIMGAFIITNYIIKEIIKIG